MKLIASLLFALCLTGCAQLVEVRTNQGQMELVAYRETVGAIHQQLIDDGLVGGARLSMTGGRSAFSCAPGESVSIAQLQQAMVERYEASQHKNPFEIEAIQAVSARSRGVRFNPSLAPD